MKKLALAAIGGTLAGMVLTAQFTGPLIAQEAAKTKSTYEQLDLFGDIFERIRSAYVEEVDEQELIESAINGMLTSLDPHSVMAGDFITQVDGESTLGMSLDDAVDLMRGEIGSEIVITIVREGTDEPFDITIVRDKIKVKAARGRLEGDSVVLRLTTFSDQTFVNLESELKAKVEEAGGMDSVTGFVIDLRNNPGGLLNQAIAVSDAFLEKGEIVSTRGRGPQDSDRVNAQPGDLAQGKPIVVLINGGSASASEIVAGALQDHRRAVVIGTRSFGKGSVQTIMPLQGDGAMRLTTARYYTPSGRSIQALGVSPDILVEQRPAIEVAAEEDQRQQRFESDLRGSLSNDSLTDDQRKLLEEEREEAKKAAELRNDDAQLAYALDVLKGLAVLGQAN